VKFEPAALIPIYNHGDAIASVVVPLRAHGLACRIVDDGSDAHTRSKLDELRARFTDVEVEHLPRNLGKGAAMARGLEWLAEQGFTHALTLDADGQHDTRDVPAFVDAARAHPEALILGAPVFSADVPKSRLHGRRISRFWVHVETLSSAIADPLCGFRCYPLAPTTTLLRERAMGTRMAFDPEIAVRLVWAGVPVINIQTRVTYPRDGSSHFRMIADNARISWMHTRLLFGMMWRLPSLLASRPLPRVESRA
jgi:glycosyltransferase involved in cell wall biosynthesis